MVELTRPCPIGGLRVVEQALVPGPAWDMPNGFEHVEFVAKAQTLASAGGSSDCAGGELRSESAYEKCADETGWHSAHREAEARADLIEAEVRRVLAEARRTEAEGRRLDAERVDIEWSVVRKVVCLFVALVISVPVFVHLLLDPTLSVGGGAGVVALLIGWLSRRMSAFD